MAIPLVYNVRSVKARWTSTIVAVVGIAGTVGVFVAMLSLARGFKATLVSSGSADNALITRAGATSEMTSGVSIDSVKIIQDAPGIARGADGPLLTPEAVLMAPIPLRSTGTDANVELRGVSPNVLAIRSNIKIVEGRMFRHGLSELVVGKNAKATYSRLTLGSTIWLGSSQCHVVAIGAVVGALNTMYSAVAERGREIATMRALGFNPGSVVLSFLFQALLISFVGGVLGCLAVLPLNGLTTSTMNFQTFSNLAFAFKITFDLLWMGVVFALIMGVLGGMPPAIRAAGRPVASALREL